MNPSESGSQRIHLQQIARRAMTENGLAPDFSHDALMEVSHIKGAAEPGKENVGDLRHLLWCSIDNDDSRDLDQLTAAETLPQGRIKIYVAIADVGSLVPIRSALDQHAGQNTTSVYTSGGIFPMLPERLSTDLTSLNQDEDRLAFVVAMTLSDKGVLESSEVYSASVRNRAKLAYPSVAAWLEGHGPLPERAGAVAGLSENIQLQHSAAKKFKACRQAQGALDLETVQAHLVFFGNTLKDIGTDRANAAKDLISEFMIAANGVTARFLSSHKTPSLRRVVRIPKRWDRIVALAAERNMTLPSEPDSVALEKFLTAAHAADPERFPDLSLSVIKLLGSGEYVVQRPGETGPGHFGLAVKDYAHTTAPNRRYPDLITQRLLKAVISGQPQPYETAELAEIGKHCTEAENAAQKVERKVLKSAAAMMLQDKIGESFDAIVTGVTNADTWVRVFQPRVEGRLDKGPGHLDVGDRLKVQLASVEVERGFIDFKRV